MIRPRTRLLVDVLLLTGFIAAAYPLRTGLPVHEWLNLALVGPALFHLVVNWDWVTKTLGKFFAKLRAASRVNLIVDVPLFVVAVTVMLSGFLVSRTVAAAVGHAFEPKPIWHYAHSYSAKAFPWLIGTHAVLHWKWIRSYLKVRRKKKGHRSPARVKAADGRGERLRPAAASVVAPDQPGGSPTASQGTL
jgi:hypothetical protein